MGKVYTGYRDISEIEHVSAPVRSIIPSLKLGDYISVQAHKLCSISYLFSGISLIASQTTDISK